MFHPLRLLAISLLIALALYPVLHRFISSRAAPAALPSDQQPDWTAMALGYVPDPSFLHGVTRHG